MENPILKEHHLRNNLTRLFPISIPIFEAPKWSMVGLTPKCSVILVGSANIFLHYKQVWCFMALSNVVFWLVTQQKLRTRDLLTSRWRELPYWLLIQFFTAEIFLSHLKFYFIKNPILLSAHFVNVCSLKFFTILVSMALFWIHKLSLNSWDLKQDREHDLINKTLVVWSPKKHKTHSAFIQLGGCSPFTPKLLTSSITI